MKFLSAYVQSPRFATYTYLAAIALTLPAFFTGFFADDYIHYALLSPQNAWLKPDDASLFGLFSFVNGDADRNKQLRDLALLPWWTFDGLKYAFWRPLAELSHWLDHSLWPRSAVMMHAHSLLWYLALCSIVGLLYNNISPNHKIASKVAFLAYTLDATHGFSVAWIANRNSLIAATFAGLSLYFYHLHAKANDRRSISISLTLLLCAMLSAEAGVSIIGYVAAYAITLDPRPARKRAAPFLLYAGTFIGWWLIYKHLGFGARNADAYYLDPTANPLLYAQKLAERIPVLLASQFGFLPAELYGFTGKTIPTYIGICLAFLAATALTLRRELKVSPELRFWTLGMLLSCAPIASALPHDRNLIFVGIGGSYIVGTIFQKLYEGNKETIGRSRHIREHSILFLNLILGILLLPLTSFLPKIWNDQMQLDAALHLEPAHENAILLGTPLSAALATTPYNYFNNTLTPKRIWILASEKGRYEFSRTDENEILIRKDQGFVAGTELSLRNITSHPFHEGDQISLSGALLRIEKLTPTGHPESIKMLFDEDTLLKTKLYVWRNSHYEKIEIHSITSSLNVVL